MEEKLYEEKYERDENNLTYKTSLNPIETSPVYESYTGPLKELNNKFIKTRNKHLKDIETARINNKMHEDVMRVKSNWNSKDSQDYIRSLLFSEMTKNCDSTDYGVYKCGYDSIEEKRVEEVNKLIQKHRDDVKVLVLGPVSECPTNFKNWQRDLPLFNYVQDKKAIPNDLQIIQVGEAGLEQSYEHVALNSKINCKSIGYRPIELGIFLQKQDTEKIIPSTQSDSEHLEYIKKSKESGYKYVHGYLAFNTAFLPYVKYVMSVAIYIIFTSKKFGNKVAIGINSMPDQHILTTITNIIKNITNKPVNVVVDEQTQYKIECDTESGIKTIEIKVYQKLSGNVSAHCFSLSEFISICTGDNSLIECISFKKIPIYQCLAHKKYMFNHIIKSLQLYESGLTRQFNNPNEYYISNLFSAMYDTQCYYKNNPIPETIEQYVDREGDFKTKAFFNITDSRYVIPDIENNSYIKFVNDPVFLCDNNAYRNILMYIIDRLYRNHEKYNHTFSQIETFFNTEFKRLRPAMDDEIKKYCVAPSLRYPSQKTGEMPAELQTRIMSSTGPITRKRSSAIMEHGGREPPIPPSK